tara:strand:- start:1163 stop:1519 length:357 start_codon:yes stop_codon:yes gene_type:complete
MLKKITVTILLLLFFLGVYTALLLYAYMLHFPLIHNAFLVGSTSGIVEFYPEWCPFPENHLTSRTTVMAALTLTTMILSPLNTLIFIKSKKKLRWFLVLLPIVLIIIMVTLYSLYLSS